MKKIHQKNIPWHQPAYSADLLSKYFDLNAAWRCNSVPIRALLICIEQNVNEEEEEDEEMS